MNVFFPAGQGLSPEPDPLVLGNIPLRQPPSIVLDLWDPLIPPESLFPSVDSRRETMRYRTTAALEERIK
jgi:hypothetical protein